MQRKINIDMAALKTFNTREEAMEYINTLSLSSIVSLCAELLVERTAPKKITITEEQFNSLFRIVGRRDDGTVENRGRKKAE